MGLGQAGPCCKQSLIQWWALRLSGNDPTVCSSASAAGTHVPASTAWLFAHCSFNLERELVIRNSQEVFQELTLRVHKAVGSLGKVLHSEEGGACGRL